LAVATVMVVAVAVASGDSLTIIKLSLTDFLEVDVLHVHARPHFSKLLR
jgi:hypothetical protein